MWPLSPNFHIMDPVEMEKLQAMAKYKKTQFHFLRQITNYTFAVILLGLVLSCPLWLPLLCTCIKSFVFVSVPKAITYLLCPKILFVISNIIVIILVGESKLLRSPNSAPDIYDEYVKRKKSYNQRLSVPAAAEKEVCYEEKAVIEKSIVKVKSMEDTKKEEEEEEEDNKDEDGEEMEAEKSVRHLEEEEKVIDAKRGMEEEEEEEKEAKMGVDELEVEEEEEEEECGLPVDELNRRVEDFIAKINQQRRLEARMLFCSG